MKRSKWVAVVLAVLATVSFMLIGCTDDEEVDKMPIGTMELLAGTWRSDVSSVTFRTDKKCYLRGNSSTLYTVEYVGEYRRNETFEGIYSILKFAGQKYAWFNAEPFKLYLIDSETGAMMGYDNDDNSHTFIKEDGVGGSHSLNQIESKLVGTWKNKKYNSTITFNKDGSYKMLQPNGSVYSENTFRCATTKYNHEERGEYYKVVLNRANDVSLELAYFTSTNSLHQIGLGVIGFDSDYTYIKS